MNYTARSIALVILLLVLAACWPAPGQGPDRNAHNPNETAITTATVGDLEQAWSTSLDRAAISDPIVSGGSLFIHTLTNLYALNISTGTISWSNPPAEGQYYAGAVVASGDNVLASDGHFTAGWNTRSYLKPSGAEVGNADNSILDTVRGNRLALQRPAILGDSAWWYLRLIDTESSTNWTGLTSIQDAFPLPVTLGKDYVFHVGNGLLATEPGDGEAGDGIRAFPVDDGATNCGPPEVPMFACPTWAVALAAPPAGPAVLGADGASVFVTTTNGRLHAFDATTGELLWAAWLGGSVVAPPAIAEGNVFVTTTEGELEVFAEEGCGQPACNPLWVSEVGASLNRQPAIAGSGDTAVVFTTASSGELRAFAATGCGETVCAPLWTADAGSQVNRPPAVSDGRLFISTTDGRVVAYGLPQAAQ